MDNNSINFHNTMDNIEHDYQIKKSMILLKQKMCKTDNLIRKYCENIKEIKHLKSDLDIAKKEAKHNITNYTSAMDKIRTLELKNVEAKKVSEELAKKISEYETHIDASEKTVHQLKCKIQDLEDAHSVKDLEFDLQKSTFKDKIKDLEDEVKKLKSISPKKPKKRQKEKISADFDTNKPSVGTKSNSNIGVNISLCDNESSMKHEVRDKNVMTDEFYNMKTDPYPLFCSKCEAYLSPDETPEKIYKTMSAYPKLIEKDLSPPPKKIYSPPRLLSNTYSEIPDSTIRNEGTLSRISFVSHRPYSPYNDSIVGNPKSGRSSAMAQICENVELRNPSINRFSSIPSTFTLSQNRNSASEDFCSEELLARHSLSIEEMGKKIRTLESKIKKFRKLKNKVDVSSCYCSMNCKNDISLNANLISVICKSVAEYYDEKKERECSTNERNVDSFSSENLEKCTCCVKRTKLKRKQSRCDAHENIFSRKIENLGQRCQVRNTFCNKTENAMKAIGILQSEDTLHENNSFLDMNISDTSSNDTDESDKREFVFHERNTSNALNVNSTKMACVEEDSLMTSRFNADKTYVSEDYFLNKDNVEALDMDNQIKISTTFLPNNTNFTDHADDITVNAEEIKLKRKSQDMHKNEFGETYASDNPSSKVSNQKEIGTALANDENSISHVIGKTANINAGEIKRKSQDEDKVDEIYTSRNPSSKDNVKTMDVNEQTKTGTISLSYDENFGENYICDKIITHESEIKRKDQDMHKDEVAIYSSNNLTSEDNVEAINMDNQIETQMICLSNKNSTDHTYDKIIIQSEMKKKSQSMHKDREIHDTCSNDNFISEANVEAVNIDNQMETTMTSLCNEILSGHVDEKTANTDAKKSEVTKTQDMHEDKVGKIHASNNPTSKDHIEAIDIDNRIETQTIFLFNDENFTDHADEKPVNINVKKSEIERKGQAIHKSEDYEICSSNNLSSKDNLKVINTDNQAEIKTISMYNAENLTDYVDGKTVNINVKKSEIERQGQDIHEDKVGEVHTNNNLSSKDNIGTINMVNQTNRAKFLSNNKYSNNRAEKIVNISSEETKMKKGQNIRKGKVGERLLKNIRNLKRKTQAIPRVNKQENVESCSDNISEYNELAKKPRIENEEIIDDHLKNIRNLKRNLNLQTYSTNKQEDDKLHSNHYESMKKLRIAHTPKTPIPQLKINENNSTHCIIKSLSSLVTRRKENSIRQLRDARQKGNLLIKSKSSHIINEQFNEKNVIESIQTNCLDSLDNVLFSIDRKFINKKDLDLTSAGDYIQKNITQSDNDVECVSEIEICNNVSFKESDKIISVDKVTRKTTDNETENKQKRTCDNNEMIEIQDDGSDKIISVDKVTRKITDNETENKRKRTCDNNEMIEIQDDGNDKIISVNKVTRKISNNETENKRKRTCDNNEMIEVQDVETRNKNAHVSQLVEEMEYINTCHRDAEETQTPMLQLIKYIVTKDVEKAHLKKLPFKNRIYIREITDQFVKKQIRRLINNSVWKDSIHEDIVKKLGSTCGPRIIAKCLIDFLLEEVNYKEDPNKLFTPPAPPMTTFEQKIITLLIDLEVLKPTVIYFVQAAIEYNLFRLQSDIMNIQVESLTRIYVVLSRIQKDREKVRIMCCNALYCMGIKSIRLLYAVLTCWVEVLPNARAMPNQGILPKCIAFLISSQIIRFPDPPDKPHGKLISQALKDTLQKLCILKRLLLKYYNYTSKLMSDIVNELMTALKAKRINGLDTAIILVAKREGPSWTYKNIIKSALLPMIIKNEHPCIYSAFSLLGKLLRAFPIEDDNIVQEISEQLRDLIQSDQVSHDQQEGIASALLSLSRHQFEIVASSMIEWMPSKSLRPIVDMQLQAFVNGRKAKFWKNYLKKNKTY